MLGGVDRRHVGHPEPVRERRRRPARRASRGRARGRRSAPARAPRRRRACPRSSARPTRRSGRDRAASSARARDAPSRRRRSSGPGASSANSAPTPRVSTSTATPWRTSASASLRTCRARPPSITGGYSQERMSTRSLMPVTLSSPARREPTPESLAADGCASIGAMSAPLPIFYFGAMSPYSWLAAERIERPAARGALARRARRRDLQRARAHLLGPHRARVRAASPIARRARQSLRARTDPLAAAVADERSARRTRDAGGRASMACWSGSRWPRCGWRFARAPISPTVASCSRPGAASGSTASELDARDGRPRRSSTRCASSTDEALAAGRLRGADRARRRGALLGR